MSEISAKSDKFLLNYRNVLFLRPTFFYPDTVHWNK